MVKYSKSREAEILDTLQLIVMVTETNLLARMDRSIILLYLKRKLYKLL